MRYLIALLILVSGCASQQYFHTKLMDYDPLMMCLNSLQNVTELQEWFFVNEKKIYRCGGVSNGEFGGCGCRVEEFLLYCTYEEQFKNWFSHYITLKALERKWKGKPLPERLKKSYEHNRRIQF